jgi:hypothetical protein
MVTEFLVCSCYWLIVVWFVIVAGFYDYCCWLGHVAQYCVGYVVVLVVVWVSPPLGTAFGFCGRLELVSY